MNELSEQQRWLQLHREEIIDPGRPIVDPHHHLWRQSSLDPYLLEDFRADTGSGHNICNTVFIECGAQYRSDGPKHLRSVGETEFVAEIAAQTELDDGATIAAIVAHADLRRDDLAETLDAHREAAGGRFRGIRHSLAWAPADLELMIRGRGVEGLFADDSFRRGLKLLGREGLTYDSWHYHFQNEEFLAVARSAPETVMILDHFGTPLGVGPYASQREEIFKQWRLGIADIAKCENVVAKLGGMAMPDNGFGWMGRDIPPSSDEFVAAQARYYHHMIDCFGPERCMFESNFPVDKLSISYPVLWNGLKKIAARYSEAEQDDMFYKTAARVYSLV